MACHEHNHGTQWLNLAPNQSTVFALIKLLEINQELEKIRMMRLPIKDSCQMHLVNNHQNSNLSSIVTNQSSVKRSDAMDQDYYTINSHGKYACLEANCTKSFCSKFSLQRHIKAFHLQEKKFRCGFCGKTFA
jgi:hypothetical protein